MALTGKKVSLKNIIAKLYRDFGLKEEDDFINFIEWGAEALEHIGVFEQLNSEVAEIVITNYKGPLPEDLVYINQVAYLNRVLFPTTNTFGPVVTPNANLPSDTGLSVNQTKIEGGAFGGVEKNHNFPTDSYSIKGGYIHASFESGCLDISYQALPLDCDGYPLVPEEISFREAVYRYLVYKYLYPQYVTGKISENVYKDSESKWYWYCSQAGAKAQMPDLNKLESIKRSYLSLRPKPNQFRTFFEQLNQANWS